MLYTVAPGTSVHVSLTKPSPTVAATFLGERGSTAGATGTMGSAVALAADFGFGTTFASPAVGVRLAGAADGGGCVFGESASPAAGAVSTGANGGGGSGFADAASTAVGVGVSGVEGGGSCGVVVRPDCGPRIDEGG